MAVVVSSLEQQHRRKSHYHYNVVVIGAGAGGGFAAGTAQLFGKTTALIENGQHIGGDCTNAACVPSKALRAAACASDMSANRSRQMSMASSMSASSSSWATQDARQYMVDTVHRVRHREDPQEMQNRNPNLDLFWVETCRFVSDSEIQIQLRHGSSNNSSNSDDENGSTNQHQEGSSTTITIQADKFVIATGASPIVPAHFQQAAARAGIPVLTYRTLLSPEQQGDDCSSSQALWDLLQEEPFENSQQSSKKKIVLVGGGATACELGQSLARLAGHSTQIHWVAPEILSTEDVRLRDAGLRILEASGIVYHRARLKDITEQDQTCMLDDDSTLAAVDAIFMCIGRSPKENLQSLDLDKAGVAWSASGVSVEPQSLQSKTNRRVYAVGDCSDAVPLRSRTATQAAWTSFHAVRNALLPKYLWRGSSSLHPCVPRVIYTEPELACVGLTLSECIERYGLDGFQSMYVPEIGSDRADMERNNRETNVCFVELRAEKVSGRILGASFCGPAAAETANTVGMMITNRLSVSHLAKSLYSYPSYGYLMHRVALSMFLSDALGLMEVCGPMLNLPAKVYRRFYSAWRMMWTALLKPFRKLIHLKRRWEARGANRAVLVSSNEGMNQRLVSFSELHANSTLLELVSRNKENELSSFKEWLSERL